MTVFVDASALVAILANEDDADIYVRRVADTSRRLTSAIAIWEATLAVAKRTQVPVETAAVRVRTYVGDSGFEIVGIADREAAISIAAFQRYGKGVDRAGLNMGDCFAYACAKVHEARLLYKGNDFDRTDLAWTADA